MSIPTKSGPRLAPRDAPGIPRSDRPHHPPVPPDLSYSAMLTPTAVAHAGLIPMAPVTPGQETQSRRLSGYGWAFIRHSDGRRGLAESGQLGGSQAGLRLDYAIGPDPARGLRLGARVSAPLSGKGREAAIGIGWKAGPDLPVTFTVERRIGLDRAGRDAFAAGIAGGIGDVALPADFRLDVYGQAGMVGLRRRDGYGDAAASAMRRIRAGKPISLSAGAGLWGAAQPGVSRLDIGPRLRATLQIGGASIGLGVDWRQRVAGHAAPRSGPAITLEGSF